MQEYLDRTLFEVAGTTIELQDVVTFLVILSLTLIVSKILRVAAVRALRLRGAADEGTTGVANRLIHYSTLAVGLSLGLDSIGISLATLFAAGAIFAVALGFAMQNITQNFVSGVILLVERTIKPGDVLEVEGELVRVSRMGIRSTAARTLDDESVILPNSVLVQNSVKNLTLRDRYYRLRAVVGVTYSSDMALVRKTLEQAVASLNWRVTNMEPRIILQQFGTSSVDWEVSVWIDHPWRRQVRLGELNEAIWWALKDAGITIAFPQVDVHFDPPVTDSMTRLAAAREA